MDIEKLKKRCGYDGKPQQFKYGFDLACRELVNTVEQAAKAQAVPEPVLDAPACVGAGTFQKGVKWSTVIGAAQRHFKYTQNAKKAPSLDIVQVKKLVSGDFVLVPKVATKQMVSAGYEAHDGFFTNGQVQDVYQAMIEAQEPAND